MKNKFTKNKIIIFSASIILIIIGGLFAAKIIVASRKNDNTVYKVQLEKYENVIEIAGTISAAQEQTLQALSDGTVLGVFVSKGDKVKKGDIIIQLDDTEQMYNLAQLDNEIMSAKITGSKKELELLQTKRISILQKVENRKVIATFDGIIADLKVAVGDYMEAKDSVGTLVNVDYLEAEVEISETDVSNLCAGQKVIFSFPAYKKSTVEGYVVSWPAIGEVTTRGATVVKATIRIDDYPQQILPNYSFTGKIQVTEPVDYLIVSSYAIGRSEGKSFVQPVAGKEKVDVKVFPYAKGFVRIAEGNVKPGDELKAQSTPRPSGMNRNRNKAGGPMGGAGVPPFRM